MGCKESASTRAVGEKQGQALENDCAYPKRIYAAPRFELVAMKVGF